MSKPFVLHAALLTLLLAACRPDAAGSGTAAASSPAQAPSGRVVLLGDEIRKDVLHECVARNVCPAGSETAFALPPEQATAAQTADAAQQAALGVLVVDPAIGPLPVTREHIVVARQARVPKLAVLFTQSDALDDKDLLELETMEMRDLLETYEMDGDHARIYVGDQGLRQLLADAAALLPRPQSSALADSRRLHGYIYNLSRAEGGHALSAGDSMDIWIGGQTVRCKLVSPQSVADGETPEVRLETERPLAASAGQRFLLQQNGRLIAAGVVEDAE
jgi:hypothetical protein